jgi:hypothetical protein
MQTHLFRRPLSTVYPTWRLLEAVFPQQGDTVPTYEFNHLSQNWISLCRGPLEYIRLSLGEKCVSKLRDDVFSEWRQWIINQSLFILVYCSLRRYASSQFYILPHAHERQTLFLAYHWGHRSSAWINPLPKRNSSVVRHKITISRL